jgi:hypothetical protein
MSKRIAKTLVAMAAVAIVAAFGYLQGYVDHARGKDVRLASAALALGSQDATAPLAERDVYYPGTEE